MLFRTLFERKLIHKKDTANANAEPAAKAVTKPERRASDMLLLIKYTLLYGIVLMLVALAACSASIPA